MALIGGVAGAISTYADPDLWGHVRFGLDILRTGHVVSGIDPYSFTQDRPFLYHEWLGGVVMAGAYRAGGVAGLAVLKAALAIAILALVWTAVRRCAFAWRWGGMTLAAWGLLPLVFTLRPQLWTGVFLVILCRVMTSSSTRAIWILPALFAAWANLHGGWIVGGGLLALWTAAAFVERTPERWHLLAAGIASLAATLINPYGVGLWMFLLETVRLGRDNIGEWEPIWRAGAPFILIWAATVGAVIVSLRRCARPPIAVVAALAGLAYAAARVNRLGPLFVLAAVTLLSRQWPRESHEGHARTDFTLAFDVCGVIAAIAAAVWVQAVPPCVSYRYDDAPDTVAAEALRRTRGRLVTSFDWGEYAIWHFGPALKVSIDGRRETLYSDRTVNEEIAIWRGDADAVPALARLAPDTYGCRVIRGRPKRGSRRTATART